MPHPFFSLVCFVLGSSLVQGLCCSLFFLFAMNPSLTILCRNVRGLGDVQKVYSGSSC